MINLSIVNLQQCEQFIEQDQMVNNLKCAPIFIDVQNGLLIAKVFNNDTDTLGKQLVDQSLPYNGYFYVYNMVKQPLLSAAFLIGNATYKQFHTTVPISIGCSMNNTGDICINMLPENVPQMSFTSPFMDVMSSYRLVGDESFETLQHKLIKLLFDKLEIEHIPTYCNTYLVDREWDKHVDEMRHRNSNGNIMQWQSDSRNGVVLPGMNGSSDVSWMNLQSRTLSGL